MKLNLNVGGIVNKLQKNATLIAFLASAYERYPDLGRLFTHYTNIGQGGALWQAGQTITNMALLKYKLWDSPHLYTTAFKAALIARLLAEVGIVVPSKYKKLTEKIMWGAGAAAVTLGGSGPAPSGGSHGSFGSSGNSPSWGYQA